MPGIESVNQPWIDEKDIASVGDVLRSGALTNPSFEGGVQVRSFEAEFAARVKVKHAVAVSSGTAALHLALMAAGVGAGDEVIVPSFTFLATATSVLLTGARPVLVDVDWETLNISGTSIKKAVTPRTKAIIVVHLYGLPVRMDEVMEVASEMGLVVIEDAAQAIGALYRGRPVGSIGDMGCFSFYATKNITTGEGGMVTTNNDELAERLRLLRTHGQLEPSNPYILGYNYRMTEYAASLGRSQLKKLDKFLMLRRRNARILTEILENTEAILPFEPKWGRHAWNLYTIRVKHRDELYEYLRKMGIGASIYYRRPVHKLKLFENLGYGRLKLYNAENAARTVISLPIHPRLTEEETAFIGETTLKWIRERGG